MSTLQILLTPVFVVRSDLPLTLLMNIETPRLKSRHQVELPGRGSENQLHTMSADMTHNVTFRLGYACETCACFFSIIIFLRYVAVTICNDLIDLLVMLINLVNLMVNMKHIAV